MKCMQHSTGSSMHIAAKEDDVKLMEALLNEGKNVNEVEEVGSIVIYNIYIYISN
jgi:hypothetical protein